MSKPQQAIRLQVPPRAGPVVAKAAEVFRRHVEQRSAAQVRVGGEGGLTVRLDLDPGIGREGFRIEDAPGGAVRIAGGDERGVVYGVGKLLRGSRYGDDGFTPGAWRGASVPDKPVRGMYFATHFGNSYCGAPVEEVQQYVEDLALWGTNALMVWFDMHHYAGIDEADAQAMLDRLAALLKAARSVGMAAGIGVLANEAYRTSPPELRSDPNTGRAHYGVELCPHKPGAKELMLRWFAEELDAFTARGATIDHLWIWPYDQGGCACRRCAPWGANGFLVMAEAISRLARARLASVKVILSTWLFDYKQPEGEWEGLARALTDRPDWVDYLLADSHEDFPRYPLQRGVPGGLEMLNFPEISMWGMYPWGGLGANPLPGRFQRLWDQAGGRLAGGFPYSEGIFEDINKAIVSQFYWDPARSAAETVREYVAFEYSPDVVDDVARAVEILEANHRHAHWGPDLWAARGQVAGDMNDAGSAEAMALMESADARLPTRARSAWRWRILYLRALIDRERYAHRNVPTDRCNEAMEELVRIYHAGRAETHCAPPAKTILRRRGGPGNP